MKIRPIQKPVFKLLFLLEYLGIITLMWVLDVRCVFLQWLGIPCPGCGMTRALLSALRLDLAGAFSYHLMFWSVPVMVLYFLFDGRLFSNKKIDGFVWSVMGLGFLVNWIIRLF